eukprot:scpid78734/ scgid6492/ 
MVYSWFPSWFADCGVFMKLWLVWVVYFAVLRMVGIFCYRLQILHVVHATVIECSTHAQFLAIDKLHETATAVDEASRRKIRRIILYRKLIRVLSTRPQIRYTC